MSYEIKLKRIYELPEPEDGKRILVDRLSRKYEKTSIINRSGSGSQDAL
ncbi:hypothetical protein [Thermoactinomyces mirandus]|nr:hypothetical protein [Thermoactinomyces mirandus]